MAIHDSVALVTGANRGLGRALTTELLARGARRVYAAARDPKKVPTGDARIVPLAVDVTDPRQIEAAVAAAGDVTLLVNNAGVLASYSVVGSALADLEQDMRTNYFGPLAMARAFVPTLERNRGAIVNVLTVVSLAPMPALGGYSASKAAAFSLTQSLRGELAGRGVRVFAVYPGPVDTDMARAFDIPKTSPESVARAIVAGLVAGDEDILPDPMARDTYAEWSRSPKSLERRFGGNMPG